MVMTETESTERAGVTGAPEGEASSQVPPAKMPEGLELYQGVPPSSVLYLQEQLLNVQAAIIREARLYAREDNRSKLEPNDVTTVAPRFAGPSRSLNCPATIHFGRDSASRFPL